MAVWNSVLRVALLRHRKEYETKTSAMKSADFAHKAADTFFPLCTQKGRREAKMDEETMMRIMMEYMISQEAQEVRQESKGGSFSHSDSMTTPIRLLWQRGARKQGMICILCT